MRFSLWNACSRLIVNTLPRDVLRCVDRLNFTVLAPNEKPTLHGGIAALLVELACEGRVDREVDDRHFKGADASVSSTGVCPISVPLTGGNSGWSEAEALVHLDAQGLRPVKPDRGLRWAIDHPEEHRMGLFLILGQKSGRGGLRVVCIITLDGDGQKRNVRYEAVRVFPLRYGPGVKILAEPKEAV